VAARWFRKIAMILSRYGLVYFLTIIEILSRSLAGEWQEKAAETLLPGDQVGDFRDLRAKLCALGSNIYPQGYPQSLHKAGGGAVCANQIASAAR
jgi:hypothetical protein